MLFRSTKAEEEVRMRISRKRIESNTVKADKKKRQENPREVKEHLNDIRAFLDSLRTAKKVATYGKFSPEAQRFVKRQYESIIDLMAAVGGEFNA